MTRVLSPFRKASARFLFYKFLHCEISVFLSTDYKQVCCCMVSLVFLAHLRMN